MAEVMNFINDLFKGSDDLWSGGVAHTLITISFVIALGRILGKTKILGISFGATWVLFVGIMFSHYGLTIDADLLHFLNDFVFHWSSSRPRILPKFAFRRLGS